MNKTSTRNKNQQKRKRNKVNSYLIRRNSPPRIILSNPPHNLSNSDAVTSTPHKVKARQFGVVLVLARRNGRRHQRRRVGLILKRRGRAEARLDRFLDKEKEQNEEERREELEECGALVPP